MPDRSDTNPAKTPGSALRRIALVTGAGSGIGRAVALQLLADGFSVVLAGRRATPLEETAAIALAAEASPPIGGSADPAAPLSGPDVLVVPADVSKPSDIESLFNRTAQEFGRLDLLFNNAGIGARPVPMEDLSLAEWQAVVDTNLTGVFLCCQAAIRIMKSQSPKGGRIINNGSISAMTPRPLSAPYTATKHAITGLTKSIALDGRSDNIACSQIDIGNAATPMTEPMAQGILQPDGTLRPEPRMPVEEVARAVSFMASLPLESNVLNMTIKATAMPFEGRG